jgi:hypothetical protein
MGLKDRGISEARFGAECASTAARGGQPMVLAARLQKNSAQRGIVGPQIVDEAFAEHRDELENDSVDHRALVLEAAKSIGQFLAKPDAPDSWKILARAAAMLTGALDRIGPAYVDRVADVKDKDSNWV